MLEAITVIEKPAALFTDAELLAMCAAYSGQLVECQTALAGATHWVESWTHRSLLSQKRRVIYSAWPTKGLELRSGPVSSVTLATARVSDVVTDIMGSTGYREAFGLEPARLLATTDIVLIDTAEDAIVIEYMAGVATRADVDGVLISAVERFTKHLFEHPGDTEGDFVRAMKNFLRPMRIANINGLV